MLLSKNKAPLESSKDANIRGTTLVLAIASPLSIFNADETGVISTSQSRIH